MRHSRGDLLLRMRRMLPRRLCRGARHHRRSLLHVGVVRPDDGVRLRGHHRDRERRLRVVGLLLRRRRLRREGRRKVERRRGLHRERLRLRRRRRSGGALHRLHGRRELHEGRLLLALLLGGKPGGGGRAEGRDGRRVLLVHCLHGGRRRGLCRQVGRGRGEVWRARGRTREAAGSQCGRGPWRVGLLLLLLLGLLVMVVLLMVRVDHVPGVLVEGRLLQLRHSVGGG